MTEAKEEFRKAKLNLMVIIDTLDKQVRKGKNVAVDPLLLAFTAEKLADFAYSLHLMALEAEDEVLAVKLFDEFVKPLKELAKSLRRLKHD